MRPCGNRLASLTRSGCATARGLRTLVGEVVRGRMDKDDKRAVFSAASHAQKTADYLQSLQNPAQADAA